MGGHSYQNPNTGAIFAFFSVSMMGHSNIEVTALIYISLRVAICLVKIQSRCYLCLVSSSDGTQRQLSHCTKLYQRMGGHSCQNMRYLLFQF